MVDNSHNPIFTKQVTILSEQVSNFKRFTNMNTESISRIKKQINDLETKVNTISIDSVGGGGGGGADLTIDSISTALNLDTENAILYTSYDSGTDKFTVGESNFAKNNRTNESIDTKKINEHITDEGLIINNTITVKNPIEWIQTQTIDAPTWSLWGNSISISGDGLRFIVGWWGADIGGTDRGAVQVFKYVDPNWVQDGSDITGEVNNDHFGYSVAMNNDGSRFVVGSPEHDPNNAGATYIYSSDGAGNFALLTTIDGLPVHANDQEGSVVDISGDGNTIATAAWRADENGNESGIVRIFSTDDGGDSWSQKGVTLEDSIAGDYYGHNISLSGDGNTIAIGAPRANDVNNVSDTGKVVIYQFISGSWLQKGNTIFGELAGHRLSAVDLSLDGNTVIVGIPKNQVAADGEAKVFEYNSVSSEWEQKGSTIVGEAGYVGLSVGMSDDANTIILGGKNYSNFFTNNGIAMIFQWNGSDYEETARFVESSSNLYLGEAVSISNDGSTALASGSGTNSSVYGTVKVLKYGRSFSPLQHININNGTITCNRIEGTSFDFSPRLTYNEISKYTGIGTANPSANLHLLAQEAYDCTLRIDTSNAYQSIIQFNKGNSTKFTTGINASDTYIIKSQNNTEQFTISQGGGTITIGSDQSETYITGGLTGNIADLTQATIERVTCTDNITDYSGVKWVPETLLENTTIAPAFLGWSVAGSSDLNVIAAGMYRSSSSTGRVRVFEYDMANNDGSYIQRGTDLTGVKSNEEFGWSVAMNNVGSIIVVGERVADISSSNQGRVRVFEWNGTTYLQRGSRDTLIGGAANDQFGYDVACSGDGSRIIVGAPYRDVPTSNVGAAYVYEWDSVSSEYVPFPTATQDAYLLTQLSSSNTQDNFGYSVEMNNDGSIVAVGAPNYNGNYSTEGEVHVFEYNSVSSVWEQKGSVLRAIPDIQNTSDRLGWSCALSADGLVVAAGAPYGLNERGKIIVWRWDGGSSDWVPYGSPISIEDLSNGIATQGGRGGTDIALTGNGDILCVGIPRAHVQTNLLPSSSVLDAGAVRTFKYNISSSDWTQYTPDLKSGQIVQNTYFGNSVAISSSGNKIAVGQHAFNSSRGLVSTFNSQILTSSIKNVIFEDNKITSNIIDTNQLYTEYLSTTGVASLVDDQYIFVNGTSNLGNTLYINNNHKKVSINTDTNVGTSGGAALEIAGDVDVDGSIQITGAINYVNPYFLSIGFNGQTGSYTVPEGSDVFPPFELNLTRFPNQSPQGDYPTTGADANYWVPSRAGIYLLTCRAHLSDSNDTISTGQLQLRKNKKDSAVEEIFVRMTHAVGSNDNYLNNSFLISTQIKVEDVSSTSGERYRIAVRLDLEGTGGSGGLTKREDYFGWEITRLG